MPTNTITYTVPANTTITRNNTGSNLGPSDVTISGTFSVAYVYDGTGKLTGQSVSAVNLTTQATGPTYDNQFGTVGTINNNEGASVTISGSGSSTQFNFTFQSKNETTTSGSNTDSDYNTINIGFRDPAALTSSATDDGVTRSLDIRSLQETYTLNGTTTSVIDDENFGARDTLSAACYTKGTLIMTSTGEVAVEDLSVGDQVMTVSGTLEPVIWLGNSTINCERQLHKDKAYPVRISKDAFGANLPKRDLFLSPDHSVYIDGAMIPAYCLINGTTITQEMTETLVTYYHVELPKHNAILAEGLPAESYLETSEENRHFFKDTSANPASNVTKMDSQYPACPENTPAWKHIWDTQGYAPLTQDGPVLAKVNKMLADRSELLISKQALAA